MANEQDLYGCLWCPRIGNRSNLLVHLSAIRGAPDLNHTNDLCQSEDPLILIAVQEVSSPTPRFQAPHVQANEPEID